MKDLYKLLDENNYLKVVNSPVFKYLGNSIVGDDKYKKKFKRLKNTDPLLEKILIKLNRQFLHAKTIGFIHPKKNKEMIFNSILPNELQIILKTLRNVVK